MKNCITIQTKKDSVTIKISEEATQEEILKDLKNKLPELKKLYKDDTTPILITGKIIKNDEMDEIKEIIQGTLQVEIEFDSPRILGLHGIKKTFNKDIATSETQFHRGSLRSGQKLEVEGSLVVIGDVNAGAEVIARDNIVVLGALRGLAHAGAKGNKEAIIATGKLEAVQIRISNIVREIDREVEEPVEQAYIYVDKDEIVIGNRD